MKWYMLIFLICISIVNYAEGGTPVNTGTDYTDAGDISDKDLAEKLSQNPDSASEYSLPDLARAIEADSSLGENSNIMQEFDKQVMYNNEILNKNDNARHAWFSYHKLNIAGNCPKVRTIVSTANNKGRLVSLNGMNAVTFNIDLPQFAGATINEDGSIELVSGTIVTGGTIDGLPGKGNLRYTHCTVDLTDSNQYTYGRVYQGTIINGNDIYLSDYETMHFTKYNDRLSVSSIGFTHTDVNLDIYVHSGSFNFHDDDHMTTEGTTSYTKYGKSEDNAQYSISTTSSTEIYPEQGKCAQSSVSCIETPGNNIIAYSKNGNDMLIKSRENTFDSIHLKEIDDASSISIFHNEDVGITYTSDPEDIYIHGPPSRLPDTEIKYDTEINGENHCHTIKDGNVLICSNCKDIGSFAAYIPDGEANDVAGKMFNLAKEKADDLKVGSDWSAKGNTIYADKNNIIFPPGTADGEKMSVKDYQNEYKDPSITEAYDCIGLLQKACMDATNDGFPWYTLSSGAMISDRLVTTQGNQAVYTIIGTQAEVDSGVIKIPDDVQKIPDIQIKFYSSREERLNAIENIPAGSAVSNYAPSGEEIHTLIKGAHRDEIAAHVFENNIYETKNGLSQYYDPLLITYPDAQTVYLKDIIQNY